MKLELHATPEEVMRAVGALQEFCRKLQLVEQDIFGLSLALEECGSNIVNHGYRRDAKQKFLVEIEQIGNVVTIEMRDSGPEFDPTQGASQPETSEDERAPGGWGIQLVRRYVDTISYRRENGENVLRLTKALKRGANEK